MEYIFRKALIDGRGYNILGRLPLYFGAPTLKLPQIRDTQAAATTSSGVIDDGLVKTITCLFATAST